MGADEGMGDRRRLRPRLLRDRLVTVATVTGKALRVVEDAALAADPGAQPARQRDPAAEAEIESLMRLVTQVRRFRSDQGLRASQPVPAVLAGLDATPLAGHEAGIRALLRLAMPGETFAPSASVQAEGVTVQLDTAAAIDIGAERRRLEKDLSAARADAAATERRLATPSFVERAPEAVVARSRERLAAAQAEIARLQQRLAALPGSG